MMIKPLQAHTHEKYMITMGKVDTDDDNTMLEIYSHDHLNLNS